MGTCWWEMSSPRQAMTAPRASVILAKREWEGKIWMSLKLEALLASLQLNLVA